jgi:formamidopyrimidine-DNA glycosylase
MPELPEVETIANGVHARVHGQRIASVWTSGKPQTFKSPETEISDALTGATIDSVRRVGKTIVMTVRRGPKKLGGPSFAASSQRVGSNPRPASPSRKKVSAAPNPAPTEFLIHLGMTGQRGHKKNLGGPSFAASSQRVGSEFLIHLGMTGRLLVSQPEVPLPPHTHAVLTLADHREIRFVDPRRFGRLSIHNPNPGCPIHAASSHGWDPATASKSATYTGPGCEPLTISLEEFVALFHGRKTPIKAALLNQSLLHGVGNIYADESLFRAGIRPLRRAGRLTKAELGKLRISLQTVLKRAIKLGGSSVSDYVDAEGMQGYFQIEHKVYGHGGEPCTTCTTPIKKIVVGGRGTHFCPTCQK